MENMFHAGDRVWIYSHIDGPSIRECEVVEWPDDDDMFLYRIVGRHHEPPYIALKSEAFVTPADLYANYRDIFS